MFPDNYFSPRYFSPSYFHRFTQGVAPIAGGGLHLSDLIVYLNERKIQRVDYEGYMDKKGGSYV